MATLRSKRFRAFLLTNFKPHIARGEEFLLPPLSANDFSPDFDEKDVAKKWPYMEMAEFQFSADRL